MRLAGEPNRGGLLTAPAPGRGRSDKLALPSATAEPTMSEAYEYVAHDRPAAVGRLLGAACCLARNQRVLQTLWLAGYVS